jgi:nitroreductase
MTAILERTMWKYALSHAYRVIFLDAGHLGQTFHLVCTKLGLAPFTTAATEEAAIALSEEKGVISEKWAWIPKERGRNLRIYDK